jgi:2,4-dienoyl-CoA reductase-like NADH-dependent reductase (Old Yellow Enzyme family)
MSTPLLFSPLSIRDVTLKNRVVVSPMHQYSGVNGFATDWHLMNVGRYAAGGAGLVFMESTKVERRGCGTVGDLGLWDDAFIPGLQRCVDFIRAHNAVPGIQLGHSGRKARRFKPKGVDVIDCSSGGMRGSPVISAGPVSYGYQVPHAERLRREAEIKTMAVGLIVHGDQAEAILAQGRADLIALARELLYNPNWPMDAAQKLGVDHDFASVPSPQAYWLAKRAQSVRNVLPSTYMKGMGG